MFYSSTLEADSGSLEVDSGSLEPDFFGDDALYKFTFYLLTYLLFDIISLR